MADLQLRPHLQYNMMSCCQSRNIFGRDRPNISILVHQNDKHVQGWNPTTNFSKIAKIKKKIEKWTKIDLDVC